MAFQALGYDAVPPRRGPVERRRHPRRRSASRTSCSGFERRRRARPRRPRRLGHLWRRAGVESVYVPNGRELGHDHYHYKLAWLAGCAVAPRRHRRPRRAAWCVLRRLQHRPRRPRRVGPRSVHGATHVSPPERDALADAAGLGPGRRVPRALRRRRALLASGTTAAGNFHKRQGHAHRPTSWPPRRSPTRLGGDAHRPQRPQGPSPVRPRAACWPTSRCPHDRQPSPTPADRNRRAPRCTTPSPPRTPSAASPTPGDETAQHQLTERHLEMRRLADATRLVMDRLMATERARGGAGRGGRHRSSRWPPSSASTRTARSTRAFAEAANAAPTRPCRSSTTARSSAWPTRWRRRSSSSHRRRPGHRPRHLRRRRTRGRRGACTAGTSPPSFDEMLGAAQSMSAACRA